MSPVFSTNPKSNLDKNYDTGSGDLSAVDAQINVLFVIVFWFLSV